jgi:hypothetical protein
LDSWARSRAIRASHVERARIVLAVADGKGTSGTAREVGVSRPTVIKWRDRFAELGLAGLEDEPRPGRPKTEAGRPSSTSCSPAVPIASQWHVCLHARDQTEG